MSTYLFVYGTLRSEFFNDFSLRLRAGATLVGKARVAGRLYLLEGYPGLRLTHGEPADWVTGELYQLLDPDALFPALDAYEGCGPLDAEPHEYQRVITEVEFPDGQFLPAWVYVYCRPVSESRRIGFWRFFKARAILTCMSTARTMPGGKVKSAELPKGPNGRSLCRWCAIEVPPRRSTFCSEWCVHEWRLRTNPGYLREKVFARDRGVCALCRKDTVEEHLRLRRARGERRSERLALWGVRSPRRSLWDADHILPVAEGGGECDLQNLRTLCLICHRKVTGELRARLKSSRAVPAIPTE